MTVGASKQPSPGAIKSVLASRLAKGTAAAASALLVAFTSVSAAAKEAPASGADAVVVLAALPPQARQTHALILAGGPFPYPHKDGSVFVNRERLLPLHPRGHYREYTVKTPGVSHRGARRIVCGGQPPTRPETCYYTADHYASFSRIVQ